MPYIALMMKAEMENVKKIIFAENLNWMLDIRAADNDVDKRERITISADDKASGLASGEHGRVVGEVGRDVNFACKFDGHTYHTMSVMVPSKGHGATAEIKHLTKNNTLEYTVDDAGKWRPIVIFECRGMEPYNWHPVGPFQVESIEGTKFDGVDLTACLGPHHPTGWTEYDSEHNLNLLINSVEFKFENIKSNHPLMAQSADGARSSAQLVFVSAAITFFLCLVMFLSKLRRKSRTIETPIALLG